MVGRVLTRVLGIRLQLRLRLAALACVTAALVGVPAAASAATKTVYADAPPSAGKVLNRYAAGFNDFFLHTVTINRGDTVNWRNDTGFHTIDLPGRSHNDLPFFTRGATVSGVNDSAGNPFWFNGHVPSLTVNPNLLSASGGTTYDGSKRIDSGISFSAFRVSFTKAGTYKYFCDVHPGMVGYVVVRPKGKSVPSTRQDAAALAAEIRTDEASAKRLAKTKVKGLNVSLGVADRNGVEDYSMFPSRLAVRLGNVVTFSMARYSREDHTASFGPNSYLSPIADSIIGPAPDQQLFYPSDRGIPTLNGSATHGNGFVNTGALDRDPSTSFPASGRIRFTKAGTYRFICLIHPEMTGTIVVH
jgi:plastocyanin